MKNRSIFSPLVRTENDLSNVLAGVMRKDEACRRLLLELLFPNSHVGEIRPDDIGREVVLPGHGRPDIVVRTQKFLGVLEVKLTAAYQPSQQLENEGSYFRFLNSQQQPARHLTYLGLPDRPMPAVPPIGRVATSLIYWHDVQHALTNVSTLSGVALEFRKYLEERFGMSWTESGIQRMVNTPPNPDTLELCKLILSVAVEAKVRPNTMESTPGEFGFTKTMEKVSIYFGYVPSAFLATGSSLVFGIDEDWGSELSRAFAVVCPKAITDGTWRLVPIQPTELTATSAEKQIWEKLLSIFREVDRQMRSQSVPPAALAQPS